MRLAVGFLSLALALAVVLAARAQSPTATLVGRVQDATGALIPGVSVTVKNVNTTQSRHALSGEDGEFAIPDLASGQYQVIAEKPGFERLIQTGLELQVDQTARLELTLTVGSVAHTLEVQAEVPLLNTENAGKGDVVVTQEIIEVPLEGRDFTDLAFLIPGVARRAEGGQGSVMAVNGARADNTNFIVDGFNNQNPRGAGAQVRPPIDTMREFKMQTTGYSAEYGRLAGGVMNMVLKTGANQPHGTLFEFLRNDIFDARNFFAPSQPKLRRHQFGASLDGPLFIPGLYNGRDRTFFLFGWESYRQVLGQTRFARIPTALERQGDFSDTRDANGTLILLKDPLVSGACTPESPAGCFPGNKIPADRFSPPALKILAYYPLPNRPGMSNNFVALINDTDRWDSFLYKIDHRLFSTDNLSFRFLKRYEYTNEPFRGNSLGNFGGYTDIHQSLFGLSYTRVFSPGLINEFRAAFTRTLHSEISDHLGHDYNADFGITGATTDPALIGFPRITIRDLASLGDGDSQPFQWTVNNFQWVDTVTWVKSKHLIKFGADVLRNQFFQQTTSNNVRGTFNFLGRWTNVPFADFLLGYLNDASRQLGKNPNYLFSTIYGFFLQDDFRVLPHVTLNLGLRYEIMKPPVEKYGRLASYIPELNKLIIADDAAIPDLPQRLADAKLTEKVGLARDYGLPASLIYTRYRNFAPRFGLAWRPRRGNRMVVRGGYGIFFATTMLNPIRNDLTSNYPLTISQTFSKPASNPALLTLANPFPASRAQLESVTNVDGYELHAPAQSLQSWNLTIEREVGQGAAIEIAYVGSKGTHLGRKYNINQPYRILELRLPNGNFPKPVPEFNTINLYTFGSNSIYNAGILTLRKRFARGFFYRASYVYSKSIDDASQVSGNADGGYPGAQDARNTSLERGRSDWDNGHAFTMSFAYEVPFGKRRLLRGWQLAGSGRMYTGQPFTPRTSNVDLSLGDANRPDRIAKGRLENRTPDRWFDLAAFPVVPRGSYRMGSSGRNILDGPGMIVLNVSLMKKFRIRERDFVQFRCEAFNLTNHPNFRQPNNNVNAINGAVITQADPARLFQFGLRYQF